MCDDPQMMKFEMCGPLCQTGGGGSLRYGAQDHSIAGMVLDSPFSNLNDLMMELVDVYKIRLPKFTVYSTSETHSHVHAVHTGQGESKGVLEVPCN